MTHFSPFRETYSGEANAKQVSISNDVLLFTRHALRIQKSLFSSVSLASRACGCRRTSAKISSTRAAPVLRFAFIFVIVPWPIDFNHLQLGELSLRMNDRNGRPLVPFVNRRQSVSFSAKMFTRYQFVRYFDARNFSLHSFNISFKILKSFDIETSSRIETFFFFFSGKFKQKFEKYSVLVSFHFLSLSSSFRTERKEIPPPPNSFGSLFFEHLQKAKSRAKEF